MEQKNNNRPMTAEEFYNSPDWQVLPRSYLGTAFAEVYANYRLRFELEHQGQQLPDWRPTEEEWKAFPEAEWAALDADGQRWFYRSEPKTYFNMSGWSGDWIVNGCKRFEKIIFDPRTTICQRPDGI